MKSPKQARTTQGDHWPDATNVAARSVGRPPCGSCCLLQNLLALLYILAQIGSLCQSACLSGTHLDHRCQMRCREPYAGAAQWTGACPSPTSCAAPALHAAGPFTAELRPLPLSEAQKYQDADSNSAIYSMLWLGSGHSGGVKAAPSHPTGCHCLRCRCRRSPGSRCTDGCDAPCPAPTRSSAATAPALRQPVTHRTHAHCGAICRGPI